MNSLEEVDARIKSLWPSMPPELVAQEMGLQKSTIVRRARALGLPMPPKPEPKPKPPKKAKPASVQVEVPDGERVNVKRMEPDHSAVQPEAFDIPFRPVNPEAAPLHKSSEGCRFPVGESPTFKHMDEQLFCCRRRDGDSMYCATHNRLVYPAPKRSPNASSRKTNHPAARVRRKPR